VSSIVYRGTCPWCFREFRSSRESCTQRHGWMEVSYGGGHARVGGRRVGSYGNVAHSGDCAGIPYPPYELSPEGTKARLRYEKNCITSCDANLAKLAKRPELFVERVRKIYDRHSGHRLDVDAPYCVRLRPGDKFTITYDGRAYSYSVGRCPECATVYSDKLGHCAETDVRAQCDKARKLIAEAQRAHA